MNEFAVDDRLAWAKRVLTEKLPHCGCGNPTLVFELVRDVLATVQARGDAWEAHRSHEIPMKISLEPDPIAEATHVRLHELLPTDAVWYFVLYALDDAELLEHGSSVPGWLTEDGKRLLEILQSTDLETLDETGYSFEHCPECGHAHVGEYGKACGFGRPGGAYCTCTDIAAVVTY